LTVDLRHLRYFQAVAEELSFSKAARRLHIAQPALSRAVQELEAALAVQLLARTRRSVALAPAGAVLLNETRLLLQRLDEATRRVQRTAAGEEGELRLGYIGPPTQIFLGRIMKEFRRRYPRVTVVLEERTPERVWEMVARGRLAIGLTRPVATQTAQLHTLVLREERLYAALPAAHPLAKRSVIRWGRLLNEPLIVLSRREGVSLFDALLTACHRAGVTPNLAHTPSLISTVLTYVEAGAGIGIVSDSICALGHGLPLVFRPLSPAQTVDLVMVWSEDNDTPPAAAFRRLLQEWKNAKLLWRTSMP
jgi:LysR family transcriptional regulator, benzoate and cis,cis-muconate-responsive activator of ben and cat genes